MQNHQAYRHRNVFSLRPDDDAHRPARRPRDRRADSPGVVTGRSLRGAYHAGRHAGVRYVATYWHFLDAVWLIMFACCGRSATALPILITKKEPPRIDLEIHPGGSGYRRSLGPKGRTRAVITAAGAPAASKA